MKKISFSLFCIVFCLLFSVNAQVKSYEKLGEMIRVNSFSTENPIYKIPYGTKNSNSYLLSATTSGKAVQKSLSYFCNFQPKDYYINFSRSATLLECGKSFDLKLKIKRKNTQKNYIYVFYDWDRDGQFSSAKKYQINDSCKNIVVDIPKKAKIGKTRIRLILSELNHFNNRADAEQQNAFIYDFVVFVKANRKQQDKKSSTKDKKKNEKKK